MSKKSVGNWNARQISKMIDKENIVFDSIIQRNLVWDNDRKSLFIDSLMRDMVIYPMLARKKDKIYSVTDGKQRLTTINAFLNNKFALTNVPEIELEDGTLVDTNGMFYDDLPEELKDDINSFMLTVYYYDDISDEQEADNFFRINNGVKLSNIEISRIKCKVLEKINEIGRHELFTTSLTAKAFEKYTHEDLVVKSYIMLTSDKPCTDNKLVRETMESVDFTEDDVKLLNSVYDRILTTYKAIIADDSPETGKISKGIAERLITRTHMLSIRRMVKKSIEDNISDEMFTNWIKNLFCGTKSVTKYNEYNTRCSSGSGHAENVKVRLKIVKKDYENFMKQMQSGNTDDNSVNSVDVNVNDIDAEFSPVVTTEPINNSDNANVDVNVDVDNTDETNETETNVEASETLSETTAA